MIKSVVAVVALFGQGNKIQLVLNILPDTLLKIKIRPLLDRKLLFRDRYCELPLVRRM
jgi:hypothetical protein